jgi:cardiolipin synthase
MKVIREPLQKQISEMRSDGYKFESRSQEKWQSLIHLNQTLGMAYLTQDNDIRLITNGEDLFENLLKDIDEAKSFINIEYFIIKNDDTGKDLLSHLTAAANRGLSVRLLVDALGTRRLDKKHLLEFQRAGGKFATFFPPKFKYLNLNFNYRNHRKLVIIDEVIGYLGGFNIGDEYLDKKKKFGKWRDTHIRIGGESIVDMNARFILDWRLASKEEYSLTRTFYEFAQRGDKAAVQIVSSGPDSYREEVKHAYLKMISYAEESIYIQTPYFVPDRSIFDALLNAARSGVDVRIMIPSIRDHIFVYWATLYYCGLLLAAGVRIFIYEGGFLHAKTLTVDSEVCSVGSANFDIRSFRLNFETNAFIFDAEESDRMGKIYEEDITDCRELTKEAYEARPVHIKIKENIAKLLSDIL